MCPDQLRSRHATDDDLPVLSALMERAIAVLQRGFLDLRQIEASWAVMRVDRQLVRDRTYSVVERAGTIAGCGGWSRRATLFGGDHAGGRDPRWLTPGTDAARIRAMYTDPAHARQGVGRLVLSLCERDAMQAAFTRAELAATLSGEPLYRACGYVVLDAFTAGDGVPLVRMGKPLRTWVRQPGVRQPGVRQPGISVPSCDQRIWKLPSRSVRR